MGLAFAASCGMLLILGIQDRALDISEAGLNLRLLKLGARAPK